MLARIRQLCSAEKALILIFIFSLPFIYPRVQVDGIGYYAYARSLLIDHNLQFAGDWKQSGGLFLVSSNEDGHSVLKATTKTGHLPNHYSVGPAILWSPFLSAAHISVLVLDRLGWEIESDGFSQPYLVSMALATAIYGFLGLWLSFQMARSFVDEKWALLATLGVWFASSLTVYMYADPSWSHALSAFCVALFLWYWLRTRDARTIVQWAVLGAISGLMLEVYFANTVFLIVPFLEAVPAYRDAIRVPANRAGALFKVLQPHAMCSAAAVIALLPTFITREIIFGSPFDSGIYTQHAWNWRSPAFWPVLFSPSHGLLVCTPLLIPAIAGLFLLWRQTAKVGAYFLASALGFYCLIAFYPWWNGVISFGNRFFVSLTPLFVIGLAAAFSTFARMWGDSRGAFRRVSIVVGLLIAWNLGLTFQYSTHLFPNAGRVYWAEVLYSEFRIVPGEAFRAVLARFAIRPS